MSVDITCDFIGRLKDAGAQALYAKSQEKSIAGSAITFGIPGVQAVSNALASGGKHAWFGCMVRPGGPWDLKANVYASYTSVSICGIEFEKDVPGNIMYGYAGNAAGFPLIELRSGAAVAQVGVAAVRAVSGKKAAIKADWYCQGFDDPRDQAAIRIGFDLWATSQLGINAGVLKCSLKAYPKQVESARCR